MENRGGCSEPRMRRHNAHERWTVPCATNNSTSVMPLRRPNMLTLRLRTLDRIIAYYRVIMRILQFDLTTSGKSKSVLFGKLYFNKSESATAAIIHSRSADDSAAMAKRADCYSGSKPTSAPSREMSLAKRRMSVDCERNRVLPSISSSSYPAFVSYV